ncbi:hypothetical protein KC333_g7333 [Hortaea werneckii]|nr:hypothetical protein KC333_g7333 [Hortaea werneckii]KAI7319488.1 hypothetical protein KC326_g3100 [Hortaea werneckii]
MVFRSMVDSLPMSPIGPLDSLFFSILLDSVFADDTPLTLRHPSQTMPRRDERESVIMAFQLIAESFPMSLIGPPDSLFFSSLLDSLFADE